MEKVLIKFISADGLVLYEPYYLERTRPHIYRTIMMPLKVILTDDNDLGSQIARRRTYEFRSQSFDADRGMIVQEYREKVEI